MSTRPQDDPSDAADDRESVDPLPAETLRQRAALQNDESGEQTLWSGGYSSKAMVGTWCLLGLLSVGLLVLAVAAPPLALLLALIPIVWVAGGLTYAWRRLGVHYELTDQRFVHQRGVISRKTDRIEVIDIDDVTFTQGPIDRVFGVGRITLTGSDKTHPTLSMPGIANVHQVAGIIDDVRRKERRRRSVHIETI